MVQCEDVWGKVWAFVGDVLVDRGSAVVHCVRNRHDDGVGFCESGCEVIVEYVVDVETGVMVLWRSGLWRCDSPVSEWSLEVWF